MVRSLDPEAGGRICLTHKELLGSWEENAARFSPGETVAGVIRSVEEYGVFVELAPNLAGLAEPCSGVTPGQQASVYIDAPWSPAPLRYFFQGSHMERWRYSTPQSSKVVETVFEGEG